MNLDSNGHFLPQYTKNWWQMNMHGTKNILSFEILNLFHCNPTSICLNHNHLWKKTWFLFWILWLAQLPSILSWTNNLTLLLSRIHLPCQKMWKIMRYTHTKHILRIPKKLEWILLAHKMPPVVRQPMDIEAYTLINITTKEKNEINSAKW